MKKKLMVLMVLALSLINSGLQAQLSAEDLSAAAVNGNYKKVTTALQQGSDPNKTVYGLPPVLFILTATFFTKGGNYNDFKTAIQTALAKGATQNVRSGKNLNTPLHELVINGSGALLKKNYLTEQQLFEIIKLLLAKGAINIKNKDGKSPLDLASLDIASPIIKRQLIDAAGMTD